MQISVIILGLLDITNLTNSMHGTFPEKLVISKVIKKIPAFI
jgi:hypothetical protein